jgi:putative exosortase-associated protein (TIGR04073 family)
MTHLRGTLAASALILSVLFAQVACAERNLLGNPEYNAKLASTKLLRGLVNVATGAGELIRQPILCTREDGWPGVPVGIINGIFMTLLRTGGGAIEVVTFPWPAEDTGTYGSLLEPEYVWQRHE